MKKVQNNRGITATTSNSNFTTARQRLTSLSHRIITHSRCINKTGIKRRSEIFQFGIRIMCILIIVVSLPLFSSCTSSKDLLYIQNSENNYNTSTIEDSKIQTNDILSIKIVTTDPEVSKFYNLGIYEFTSAQNPEISRLTSYLVSNDGFITFPLLGRINVLQKSNKELESYLQHKLNADGYIKKCDVIIRTINSKFTVLGEVRNPGTFNFSENNLSLFQALGLAGDLTINGDRKNITLIRNENNSKEVLKFDLTSARLLSESTLYIKKNDILIVNPNDAKVKSAGIIGNPAVILSGLSLLLSGLILLSK